MQVKISDVVVTGFALFAMFFGAGNVIFPPYLGMTSGTEWLTGFLCFIFIDVFLFLYRNIYYSLWWRWH